MKKILTFLFLASVTFVSCEKDFEASDFNEIKNEDKMTGTYDSKMNPFSVQRMNEAILLLQKEGRLDLKLFPDFSVKATHVYLKFKPLNEEEEGMMKSDSTYFVFDYPLHLSPDEEDFYLKSRKDLLEDEDGVQIEFPTYYTAVPSDKVLKLPVKFEMIDELYIPEEDPYFDKVDRDGDLKGPIIDKDGLFENLIYTAYLLAGREQELKDDESNAPLVQSIWLVGKKWTPSGELKIWDSTIQEHIPLRGAQVLLRQVFTIRQGITDSQGKFQTGTIRGKARYILQWERYHYSIRTNSFFQAESRGPNEKNKAWKQSVVGGSDQYYGTIHHAAYLYYYTNRFGFESPPKNGSGKKQMKIAARKKTGTSSHANQRSLYFGSQISIQEWSRNSDRVFSSTIHELTHAAHHNFDKSSYNSLVKKAYIPPFSSAKDGAKRLLETWGTTAEIYLTNHWYIFVLGKNNYEFRENSLQLRLINNPLNSDHKYYTSAGNDMIEHFNQGAAYGAGYPIDRVSGYTPAQLQSSLHGATHWSGWKDNIKSQHTNSTSIYLDELFNNW